MKKVRKKPALKKAKNGLKKTDQFALYQGLAGSMDVLGTVGAALLVIVLLFMFTRLASWLRGDLNMLFSDMNSGISNAVLIYRH